MRSVPPFGLMHWAKQRAEAARFSLGASGVSSPTATEIASWNLEAPPTPNAFTSVGNYYGADSLRREIATKHEVGEDSVLVSNGTSLANYNALAVLATPGTRVLVETPTYPALPAIPTFQGAAVEPLARSPKFQWAPSLDAIRSQLVAEPGVSLIVLTRLHNPTGVDLNRPFLEGLATLAEEHEFLVLFDEIYLDFLHESVSAHHFSPRFVTTTGLTKVYGFGGLRVGWVVGAPEIVAPMREFSFYLAVNGSTLAQETGAWVLRNRAAFLKRSRAIAREGQSVVESWIASRDDVEWTPPDGALSAFIRLPRVADTAKFAIELFAREEVAVAEGEYFGAPGWIRVCFGGPRSELEEALSRVGHALDRES